ncbi:stage II sporulation protein M [Nonomuraea sp. NPDC050404]|uniref:stage II sporulation protein M n=1 Tax=Nonomuraea sp. NPDC050404 TaxID=3155783 RepID=UPI00340E7253
MLNSSLTLIRRHARLYASLNVMTYGLVVAGMVLGALSPELNAFYMGSMDASGDSALIKSLLSQPWMFAVTILAVNLTRVALVAITLPSMIVPFAGIPFFAYFAFTSGIKLAPVNHDVTMSLIPHSLTLVVEFQAYVLLLFGACLLGRAWIRPARVGATSRRQAWVRGMRLLGVMWVPALVLFIVGALYEAFSIVYIVPLLVAG